MKLSVIIPAYNRAEMIRGTIDSVLNSGLDDFEILVVDDGSTDRTADIVPPTGFADSLSPAGITRALPRPETTASQRAAGSMLPFWTRTISGYPARFQFWFDISTSTRTFRSSSVTLRWGRPIPDLSASLRPSAVMHSGICHRAKSNKAFVVRPRAVLSAARAAERCVPGQPGDATRSHGTGRSVRPVSVWCGGLDFFLRLRCATNIVTARALGRDLSSTLIEYDERPGPYECWLLQGTRAIARRPGASG